MSEILGWIALRGWEKPGNDGWGLRVLLSAG